jgi:4-amino-4-deoxy-L-arabinose transferase-like glycosyltransferase
MTATLERPAGPAPEPVRPRWERGALAALLLGTAALYLVGLSVNGWANEFYSGAVQAMTRSWEAFFFGASDAGGTVTVDKPPASLWVMAASARIFGVSSWSVLVPQALMGVATVALLHAAVRRVAGPGAALVAGAAMALTPVAVLMFRFNNPDALLVLLLVAAAYAVVRALERADTRWLLLAGALVGLAFLTKTAQAFLPLPAFALVYLCAAPTGLWRRVRQLLAAGAVMVVVGGWWFAVVDLWPAGDRPYIGGSTTNSALELALGYNGLERIFGFGGGPLGAAPAGAVPPGAVPYGAIPPGAGGTAPFGPEPGLGRLFALEVGAQVAWLLPAALVLAVVGLWLTRRAPRTDRVRASLLLWGGWTLVTGLVFSLMSGIFHEYYTVALAPGVAALVGIGGAQLWQRRASAVARIALAAVVAGSAVWAAVLLVRTPQFVPWAPYAVAAVGLVAVVGLLIGARTAVVGLVATALALSTGPAAYAVAVAGSPQGGAIPLAGPLQYLLVDDGGNVLPDGAAGVGVPDGTAPDGTGPGWTALDGTAPDGTAPDGTAPDGTAPDGTVLDGTVLDGALLPAGGPEAVLAPGPALTALLRSAGTRWSAATMSASSAALLALESRTDVMGIGGFSGIDPAPTLAQFQAAVAAGEIRWFVAEDLPPDAFGATGPGATPVPLGFDDGSTAADIRAWVEENFTASTVDGRTVHDLSSPKG